MKKITKFDIGFIIAFVVVGLLGGGAAWWESTQLSAAQDDCANAKADFDKYSLVKSGSDMILVSTSNRKTLQDNSDLFKAQINPLILNTFLVKDNKLGAIEKVDPVAWKHDLDDEVRRLTASANHRNVKIPPNFYFSFSRYLNQNPDDEQTVVLSKQLLAVEQLTNILLNAPVREIKSIQRTWEEDPHPAQAPTAAAFVPGTDADRLEGYAYTVNVAGTGPVYTDYPFQVEFETTSESLRKVMADLLQSPYIMVVRIMTVDNLKPVSPQPADLDKIAGGSGAPSVVNSDPGAVAATTSTVGPQYIFGNANLHVKARIDLVEWNAPVAP